MKHKALLAVAYSAGLRVGEVVSPGVKDIDSQRMLIHVKQGKAKAAGEFNLIKFCMR